MIYYKIKWCLLIVIEAFDAKGFLVATFYVPPLPMFDIDSYNSNTLEG